jgi:translation initiation factor IF-2
MPYLNHQIKKRKREEASPFVVFPVILEALPGSIFSKRDPIVIGVKVLGCYYLIL